MCGPQGQGGDRPHSFECLWCLPLNVSANKSEDKDIKGGAVKEQDELRENFYSLSHC